MKRIIWPIYNQLVQTHVGNTPELNEEAMRLWGQVDQNVLEHYTSYLANFIAPNSIGPIEKHPYLTLYEGDFSHKRRFLILGTFPPSTYFNNLNLPGLPNANIGENIPLHYYYGNMNSLWKYLLELNIDEIPAQDRINTISLNLVDLDISISDVFSFVQRRRMIDTSDSSYKNIIPNRAIAEIFNPASNIDTVLFTSGSLRSFQANSTSTLTGFRWILNECLPHIELEVSGVANGNGQYFPFSPLQYNQQSLTAAVADQNGGIIWWLRTKEKRIRIINLPSPSGMANMNMYNSSFFLKWVNYKAIHADIPRPNAEQLTNLIEEYLPLYPDVFPAPVLNTYKSEVYQMALDNTIDQI